MTRQKWLAMARASAPPITDEQRAAAVAQCRWRARRIQDQLDRQASVAVGPVAREGLDDLKQIHSQWLTSSEELSELVDELRARGTTWADIAASLGESESTVRRKFGRHR